MYIEKAIYNLAFDITSDKLYRSQTIKVEVGFNYLDSFETNSVCRGLKT